MPPTPPSSRTSDDGESAERSVEVGSGACLCSLWLCVPRPCATRATVRASKIVSTQLPLFFEETLSAVLLNPLCANLTYPPPRQGPVGYAGCRRARKRAHAHGAHHRHGHCTAQLSRRPGDVCGHCPGGSRCEKTSSRLSRAASPHSSTGSHSRRSYIPIPPPPVPHRTLVWGRPSPLPLLCTTCPRACVSLCRCTLRQRASASRARLCFQKPAALFSAKHTSTTSVPPLQMEGVYVGGHVRPGRATGGCHWVGDTVVDRPGGHQQPGVRHSLWPRLRHDGACGQ